VNKLERKIDQIFSKKTSNIGFGNTTAKKIDKKILLFIETDLLSDKYNDSIDGLVIKNIEIDNFKKIKSNNLVGIKYPDKLLDINKIANNNYDFVIIDDKELSYKYLDNNSRTIYQINEDITDDDADTISSFDFPVLYIEFKENLNFDQLESFFKLSKITSKFNCNFFIKTNRILSTDQLQILFNLGIIGLILDSKISNKKNILNLNKNLMNINTEKKKTSISPDLSSNLASSVEDDFDE
tara:strand:+ start:2469 stop:3188 length:720 start_codon:yes stop_codon:yes gene_type:complete